jgi:hypothetical protein
MSIGASGESLSAGLPWPETNPKAASLMNIRLPPGDEKALIWLHLRHTIRLLTPSPLRWPEPEQVLSQVRLWAEQNVDLNQQLQKLKGPVLGPADIAQPLPLL